MAKLIRLGFMLVLVCASGARAQTSPTPGPANADQGGAGIRSNNITSTGSTVPNPGVSQSGGTTPMDRGIQREDDRIQSGICKGC